MQRRMRRSAREYQVWMIDPGNWTPHHWRDRPAKMHLVAEASDGLLTAAQANAFLQGFNGQLLRQPKQRWGVKVKVRLTASASP